MKIKKSVLIYLSPIILFVFIHYSIQPFRQRAEFLKTNRGPPPLKNYGLVIATQVHNMSLYIAEWIEHHRLVGVDRIIMYNDIRKIPNQGQSMRAIVDPWIQEGFLEWVDWPKDAFDENHLKYGNRVYLNQTLGQERFNYTLFTECIGKEEGLEWHKHSKCQRAAFMDAIARYRHRSKWIGIWDIDEFMYVPLPKNTRITNESEIPSLKTALQSYNQLDQVTIVGRIFGTNGYMESPIRPSKEDPFPLVMEHYKYRHHWEKRPKSVFLQGHDWAEKSFCKPEYVSDSMIHGCNFEEYRVHYSAEKDDKNIYMNHYQYRSIEGAYVKAKSNTNWDVVYQSHRDIYFNQIPDNNVDYLVPFIKKSLEKRAKNKEWQGDYYKLPHQSDEIKVLLNL
jgi:hypothetical protein